MAKLCTAHAKDTGPDGDALVHRTQPRRTALLGTVLCSLLIAFLQSPGLIAPDTKHDLTANPGGFLDRASHLWSSILPFGQVQNQAYGYFFPQGPFFWLGHTLHIPAWITQRLWWALLLWLGWWGMVRLVEALRGTGGMAARAHSPAGGHTTAKAQTAASTQDRLGTLGMGLLAGIIYATSPRVLTTLGAISSETLPVMLAPWILAPVVTALHAPANTNPSQLRRSAFLSALAVACCGGVNAVATLAALLPAVLWWGATGVRKAIDALRIKRAACTVASRTDSHPASHSHTASHPARRPRAGRQWWIFTGWWALSGTLACLWWLGPLLLLGRYSPPFLDYIESATITTRWMNLTEVLRGTSHWTTFVSAERAAGADLVQQPIFVVATAAVAAAGLAGIVLWNRTQRPYLILLLGVGCLLICLPWVGGCGPTSCIPMPLSTVARTFLDGPGAALRNLHKFDPLLRIPLAFGASWVVTLLLRRVPHRQPAAQRSAFAALVILAVAISSAPLWTGRLAPEGSYRTVPDYWQHAADWLSAANQETRPAGRALVVPGSNFANNNWGLTRDEPLQPLADIPWVVRDAIPLVPGNTIRAMDSVQELFADGRPSPGLAPTLLSQGVRFLLVRNDLHLARTSAPHPLLVHRTLDGSPGLRKIAEFGPQVTDPASTSGGLPVIPYPALEIYDVSSGGGTNYANSLTGNVPGTVTVTDSLAAATTHPGGPWLVDTSTVPLLTGGPEAILTRNSLTGSRSPLISVFLAQLDAIGTSRTPFGPLTVTDTPQAREIDFGRVDHHSSPIRSRRDRRYTTNRATDYATDTSSPLYARWYGAYPYASSSTSDVDQLAIHSLAHSPAAAVDGNPHTAWLSALPGNALGQYLQLDLLHPLAALAVQFTIPTDLPGPAVTRVVIRTNNGSSSVPVQAGSPITAPLPPGVTEWVRVTAATPGGQFGLKDVRIQLTDTPTYLPIGRDIPVTSDLPSSGNPHGRLNTGGWILHQTFPGGGRCAWGPRPHSRHTTTYQLYCSDTLLSDPEEANQLERTLVYRQAPATAVTPTILLRLDPRHVLQPQPGCHPDMRIRLGATGLPLRLIGPVVTDTGSPAGSDVRSRTGVGSLDQLYRAEVCDGTPLPLPAAGTRVAQGHQVCQIRQVRVTVTVPQGWVIDTVALTPTQPNNTTSSLLSALTTPQTVTTPRVLDWEETRRTVRIPRSEHSRLLVIPESTNPGWVARWTTDSNDTAGGRAQDRAQDRAEDHKQDRWHGRRNGPSPVALTSNGWSQAWLLPPHAHGTLELVYTPDRWYRGLLFGGLGLLPLLLLGAAWPVRGRRRMTLRSSQDEATQMMDLPLCADKEPSPALWRHAAIAAGLFFAAGLSLAHTPWGPFGNVAYAGNEWYTQLLAALAVIYACAISTQRPLYQLIARRAQDHRHKDRHHPDDQR